MIEIPPTKSKRGDEPEHEIPLVLLLLDAAQALELVQLHGLSRACLIANSILTGEPVLGESFVRDVVECVEAAKLHAYHDSEDTRVALIASVDTVETWGLEPARRLNNAVRELVASLETIRQISATRHSPDGTMEINAIAERALGVLGFKPYEADAFADDEDEGAADE